MHHGGFGTSAAALQAGVPSIVIPHIIDQLYWSQLVYALGVGPKYIGPGKLAVPALQAALIQALTDETMRAKAAVLGVNICADPDGVS